MHNDEIAARIETGLDDLAYRVHLNSVLKGFYNKKQNAAEKLCLVHAEISEAVEELRHEAPRQSEKIPGFTAEEEEIADAIIRLADYAEWRKLRIGPAVVAKAIYNTTRPFKHGKKF